MNSDLLTNGDKIALVTDYSWMLCSRSLGVEDMSSFICPLYFLLSEHKKEKKHGPRNERFFLLYSTNYIHILLKFKKVPLTQQYISGKEEKRTRYKLSGNGSTNFSKIQRSYYIP